MGSEELKYQRCSWSWRQHVLLLKILICFVDMFLLELNLMITNYIYPLLIGHNGTYPPLLMLTVFKSLPCTQIPQSFEATAVHARPSYKRLRQGLPIPGGFHWGTAQGCPQ